MRAGFLDHALNLFRKSAAALRVDVCSVRFVVHDGCVRAELAQNAGRGFVSGAVRHVHRHPHFLQRHSARKTRLGKLDVTAKRVIDSAGPSDLSRGRPDRIDLAAKDQIFDLLLDLVVELVAVVPEKFDSVIFVRIVRRGENDARVGPERSRDVSYAGSWQRPDDQNIDAERGNACDQRVLEHVTGEPRVLAENNLRPRAL